MRVVRGIQFDHDEAAIFERALPHGFDLALGIDEKERPLVRRWRIRLTQLRRDETDDDGWVKGFTDVFFEDDLLEAAAVLRNLARRFDPETDPAFWRENAALGGADAIEGLAKERELAVERLIEAAAIIEGAGLEV